MRTFTSVWKNRFIQYFHETSVEMLPVYFGKKETDQCEILSRNFMCAMNWPCEKERHCENTIVFHLLLTTFTFCETISLVETDLDQRQCNLNSSETTVWMDLKQWERYFSSDVNWDRSV